MTITEDELAARRQPAADGNDANGVSFTDAAEDTPDGDTPEGEAAPPEKEQKPPKPMQIPIPGSVQGTPAGPHRRSQRPGCSAGRFRSRASSRARSS